MTDLLEEALTHINCTKGKCPVCKYGELVGGPCGGCSQNFRCDLCSQEFNLGLVPLHLGVFGVWTGQSLGKDDNRKELYTGKRLSEMWK